MKILLPQEFDVWYFLPLVRKQLATILKGKGCSQKQIAEMLGVTQAAVSQYIHDKRADDINIDAASKKAFQQAAQELKSGKTFFDIAVSISREPSIQTLKCKLHKKYDTSLPQDCDVCYK